jgi:hypothetical protein
MDPEGFRRVDFGHFPLESPSKLKAIAKQDYLEDKRRRLAQIQALPLSRMTLYCKDLLIDRRKIEYLLCNGRVDKEEWAVGHFRFDHWT